MFKTRQGKFIAYKEYVKKGRVYQTKSAKLDLPIESSESDQTQHILIQIVNKEVKLSNKPHVLTFLKDVTFGVLYEQIKAQDNLKRMVNNTLQQKIGWPL